MVGGTALRSPPTLVAFYETFSLSLSPLFYAPGCGVNTRDKHLSQTIGADQTNNYSTDDLRYRAGSCRRDDFF